MKKFLSLVLALVMTMSLVTISAGAKDFTDNDKVNYDEAVQVISLLGVVNGYEDGSFKPANTLTRGAAAKIICNLLLTPAVADTLPANNTGFKDVPSTNVFAKYIAYCANAEIINGYGDGTFRPAATLTGYAFMKMLLGALGYDAQIEGFTGNTFALNVASKIGELKLAKGNDTFVGTKAVTREEAALYAFNMLSKDMVKYASKGTKITVNGVEIIQGASPAESTKNTFASVKFSGLKEGNKPDDFGRNYKTWSYKGTTITLLASKADKVYYGEVSVQKIYKDLGLKDIAYKFELAGNTTATVPAKVTSGSTFYNWKAENGKDAMTFGGMSYVVEVYYIDAAKEGEPDTVKIVPVQYLLGRVAKVTKASGLDERTVTIYATTDGVKNTGSAMTFETESFAKGDVVLYTKATTGIQSVQLAKSIKGEVTGAKGTKLTIGGVKYDAYEAKKPGTEGTFYLSVDNSIIGFNGKDVVSYANYAYVYSTVKVDTADEDGLKTEGMRAYFVKADGTKGNAMLAKNSKVAEGNVYAYTINADGEFVVAKAAEDTYASDEAFVEKTIGKSNNKVDNFYMGTDTKFIFVDTDGKLDINVVENYKNVADGKAKVVIVGSGNSTRADAKVVFVQGKTNSAASDAKYAFLLDTVPEISRDTNGKEVYIYSVMIDGDNKATLTASVDSKFNTEGNVVAKGGRFEYTLKDGLLDTVKASKVDAANKQVMKAGNGYMDVDSLGVKDLAKDCIVYSYDSTSNTYGTDVTVLDNDMVDVYLDKDGDISMIVVVGHNDDAD